MGSRINMNCRAIAVDDAVQTQIMWTKDGKSIVEDSDHSINTTNLNSNLEITNFAQSDAGVYQCIVNVGTELATTKPFRLQTGE